VLEVLEAHGAGGFDAASCGCVRMLLERAEALDSSASTRLVERAGVHLERLAERFAEARTQTQQRLDAAEQVHGALPSARAAFARGELVAVRLGLRRLDRAPAPDAARAERARREKEHARCSSEYDTALAGLSAICALARAADVVPEHAGPYNPLRIASDLLACIGKVSPIYLTSQLNRLEELASMLALPELPVAATKPTPPPKPPPKSRRTTRGRS
jgi:hypothetical protein